jgi:type III restriction enzyme
VNLAQWRTTVRVQQVAFTMAKVLTQQWIHERGDVIPTHRLFPQMLGYAQRFLSSKLKPSGNRAPQDVALNPYFQQAVGMLFDSLVPVDESGQSQERPIIAPGPAGERSTRHVEFYTGRQPWPVQKCHLNAIVADTKTWEQSAATALDAHPAVTRWVKNDHLGFTVPYRKDGVRRSYLPDFIVDLVTGERLAVEIKGQTGDAEIKAVAAHRWCNAVNNDGRFGRWSYHIVRQPPDLMSLLDKLAVPSRLPTELSIG